MDTGKANRKRGIIASRAKLENAMLAAGVRTQMELAERIAAAEQAGSVPKDMVSRAFRQVPIDPKSLQRIAAVLNVPAYLLYLAGDELHIQQHQPLAVTSEEVLAQRAIKITVREIAILSVTVICLAIVMLMWSSLQSTSVAKAQQPVSSSVKNVSLAVEMNRREALELAGAVKLALLPDINLVLQQDEDDRADNHVSLISRSDVAGVLTFNLFEQSRFSVIEILYRSDSHKNRVSYHVFESALLQPGPIAAVANTLAADILAYVSDSGGSITVDDVDVTQRKQYLQARLLLDAGRFTLYQDDISALLNKTLEHEPYFAPAYAALCQMYRLKSWTEEGQAALADAAEACGRAFSLAPQDQFVLAMNAKLALAVDAPDVAQTFYDKMLVLWPDNPWALQGLACLNIKRYKRDSRLRMLLTDAVNYLQRAISAEPDFYLHHHTLSLAYYFLADTGASQLARRQAASLINNPDMRLNILANTMCAADNVDSVATASLH